MHNVRIKAIFHCIKSHIFHIFEIFTFRPKTNRFVSVKFVGANQMGLMKFNKNVKFCCFLFPTPVRPQSNPQWGWLPMYVSTLVFENPPSITERIQTTNCMPTPVISYFPGNCLRVVALFGHFLFSTHAPLALLCSSLPSTFHPPP